MLHISTVERATLSETFEHKSTAVQEQQQVRKGRVCKMPAACLFFLNNVNMSTLDLRPSSHFPRAIIHTFHNIMLIILKHITEQTRLWDKTRENICPMVSHHNHPPHICSVIVLSTAKFKKWIPKNDLSTKTLIYANALPNDLWHL